MKLGERFIVILMLFFIIPSCRFMEKRGEASKGEELVSVGLEESRKELSSVKRPVFVFKRIKSGKFEMGSPLGESYRGSDEGQKPVEISKPFEMMDTEVTQEQWYLLMGDNPSRFKREGDCANHRYVSTRDGRKVGLCPGHPVESVSWNKVQGYIKELNYRFSGKGDKVVGIAVRFGGLREAVIGCRVRRSGSMRRELGGKTAYFFGR